MAPSEVRPAPSAVSSQALRPASLRCAGTLGARPRRAILGIRVPRTGFARSGGRAGPRPVSAPERRSARTRPAPRCRCGRGPAHRGRVRVHDPRRRRPPARRRPGRQVGRAPDRAQARREEVNGRADDPAPATDHSAGNSGRSVSNVELFPRRRVSSLIPYRGPSCPASTGVSPTTLPATSTWTRRASTATRAAGWRPRRSRSATSRRASTRNRRRLRNGSAISDGNAHDHGDLPILVAGHAGGFKGGFHRRVKRETPIANLYLSLLDRLNVRATTFGDATGRLDGV